MRNKSDFFEVMSFAVYSSSAVPRIIANCFTIVECVRTLFAVPGGASKFGRSRPSCVVRSIVAQSTISVGGYTCFLFLLSQVRIRFVLFPVLGPLVVLGVRRQQQKQQLSNEQVVTFVYCVLHLLRYT